MSATTFQQFETAARAEGFDEVIERRWEPMLRIDTHKHPFALKAVVVQGEFWLTVGDSTRHLRCGDRFELAHDVPHAERYGAEGATFWVARRHGV
jgi:quercetin dioxygenase-like cupin family protein